LEIDENFFEAFIALGSYNYWKSAQTKSLLWIPFIPDKRLQGIQFLEKALEGSSYNKYLAAYSLAWIYIDYGESDKAIDLSKKMLKDYNESRYFRWCLARAYQDVDKYKAIEVFKEILESIEKLPFRNQYNDIVIRHKIAMLYYDLGEYKKASNLCNEILDFNIKSNKIKDRLSDRLNRTKQLRLSLQEKLKDN
jgi:tetratricopeptide (TPR) repeat protein